MTDPVIVADTINVSDAWEGVYYISALVTATTREEGQYVSVQWNPNSGDEYARSLLIAAYNDLFTCQSAILQAQLRTSIGTDMPAEVVDPVDPTVTINAASVTVYESGGT